MKKNAKALPIEDLQRIVVTLAIHSTPWAALDNTILQRVFFSGFGRSELAGIEVEHGARNAQEIVVMLTRSRTDPEGDGIMKAIPCGDGGVCCPERCCAPG